MFSIEIMERQKAMTSILHATKTHFVVQLFMEQKDIYCYLIGFWGLHLEAALIFSHEYKASLITSGLRLR